jgi:hypothetical protein
MGNNKDNSSFGLKLLARSIEENNIELFSRAISILAEEGHTIEELIEEYPISTNWVKSYNDIKIVGLEKSDYVLFALKHLVKAMKIDNYPKSVIFKLLDMLKVSFNGKFMENCQSVLSELNDKTKNAEIISETQKVKDHISLYSAKASALQLNN